MTSCQHAHCQEEALAAAERVCLELGARFTPHRREAFQIIWQSHQAMTAAEVMAQMSNKQPPITYRALSFLKDVGLLHYIASLNAYVGCIHPCKGGHLGHMLICERCRHVTELTPDKVFQALTTAAQAEGFSPRQVHVEMLGLCAACQQAA